MELIPLAKEIWEKKYKAASDKSITDTFARVAKGVSAAEISDKEKYENKFYDILSKGFFFPGGRITNDVGVNGYLNNCFCIGLNDSIEEIYDAIKKVAVISKNNGGCGFSIDNLRPKDSPLSGGGTSSGSVSWLNIFDTSCSIIKTAGNRRAALISVMSIWHPDIEEYIDAKRETGKLENFNISVAISHKFIDAIKNDLDWNLVWGGKVYKTVKARYLWDKLAYSGWMYNDPGILWEDTINYFNDMSYLYKLKACNPCGELSLPADDTYGEGSCCLGNVNTTKFVKDPFKYDGEDWRTNFDFISYEFTIRTAVRFLDDVLDISKYPYETNKKIAQEDRRIGLNHISGIGSTLAMLKIPYDSDLAIEVVTELSEIARNESVRASINIAKEKGSFPNFLFSKYSQGGFFKTLPLDIQNDIAKYGIRNCAIGSIPPAGTGSLLMGNISNGIEPFFMTEYNRNIRQPDGSIVTEAVEDYAWAIYKKLGKPDGNSPDYFRAAREISVESHLNIQATVQKYIAGNISKTVNLPESCTLEDYKKYMLMSWELGCRGFTSFRDGTRAGVLEAKDIKPTITSSAPIIKEIKRPRSIDGKIYQIPESNGRHTYCTIGHVEENGNKIPWEMFLASSGDKSEEYAAIGRLASRLMRKTKDVQGVIDELREVGGANGYLTKEYGYVNSRVQHLSFILQEYVDNLVDKEKVVEYSKCPSCGENTYMKEGGCNKCLSCGNSSCG